MDVNPNLQSQGWQVRSVTRDVCLLWRSNGFSRRLLITFDALADSAHLRDRIGSDGVAIACEADHLHIASAGEHWFQTPEIHDVLATARLIRDEYDEALLYGHSMGAYGALLFSGPLNATNVVAFAPQISIDPGKVPFDPRFRGHAERTSFVFDDILASMSKGPKHVVYDPRFSIDRMHFDFLARAPGIHGVPIPFAGHYPGEMLQEGGILRKILLDLLLQTGSLQERRRTIRAARRRSHRYFVECAQVVKRRGNIRVALALVNAAYILAPDNPSVLETYFAVLHTDHVFFGVAHAVLRLVKRERPEWAHYDNALAELWRDLDGSVIPVIRTGGGVQSASPSQSQHG